MTARGRALCLALGLALGGGCGYELIDPGVGEGRSLAVPTAANDTRWRGVEATLTAALRSDLQRRLDVRLREQPADLVLRTEVREIVRGAAVREEGGGAALGTATLELTWQLEDALGEVIRSGRQRRSTEFLPGEGESAYTAIAEILDSMAESVVIEICAGLRNERKDV